MSTGKYLSLEEAQKKGLIKRFAKNHKAKGDMKQFDDLLNRMVKEKKKEK
jgi:hypothetical protein